MFEHKSVTIECDGDIKGGEGVPERSLDIVFNGLDFGGVSVDGAEDAFDVFGGETGKDAFYIVCLEFALRESEGFFGGD